MATNGAAVFALFSAPVTNRVPNPFYYTRQVWLSRSNLSRAQERRLKLMPAGEYVTNVSYLTNKVFQRFLPGSLNYTVWTNLLVRTNGRSTAIWSTRSHPAGWPTNAPAATWNTKSLLWGMRGFTALSPCWEGEGSPGQVPITALTRRHGYTRGHGMGPSGFTTACAGRKVWFLAPDNTVVETTIARAVVRTASGSRLDDYTIFLFSDDLPDSIEPLSVASSDTALSKYPLCAGAPWPLFLTEQGGNVSAEVPGFTVPTYKGGDSGSPNLLPLPGELVFLGGRSTTGASPAMQDDMDALCRAAGLDPKRYQLRWADLTAYPSFR